MLAPVLDPFHGPIEPARDGGDQEVLRVEFTANAEAASRIRHLHDDRALRKIEHRREHAAVEERHLGDAEHGHALPISVPDRCQPARLHGNGSMPLNGEALAPHVISSLESRIRVAATNFYAGRVRSGAVVDQDRAIVCLSQFNIGGRFSMSAEIKVRRPPRCMDWSRPRRRWARRHTEPCRWRAGAGGNSRNPGIAAIRGRIGFSSASNSACVNTPTTPGTATPRRCRCSEYVRAATSCETPPRAASHPDVRRRHSCRGRTRAAHPRVLGAADPRVRSWRIPTWRIPRGR